MNMKKALWTVFTLLMLLNLVQIAQNIYLADGLLSREAKIAKLQGVLYDLSSEYRASIEELSQTREELTHAESKLADAQKTIVFLDSALEKKEKQIYTLGVSEGRGVPLTLTVEMVDGSGRLLADMRDVLFETNVQSAMRNAYLAAQKATGADMTGSDFIFTITIPLGDGVVLRGESAGAAMAVALVALVEEKEVRNEVVITGAIAGNGRILKVSQIEEKAEAAKKVGATLLLVPKGQDAEFGEIDVVEVDNLSEAVQLMLY